MKTGKCKSRWQLLGLGLLPLAGLFPVQGLAGPLYSKNLAPVAGLIGFPVLREAATLERGQFKAAVFGSVANNYSVDTKGSESVNFDGEVQRFAGLFAIGLGSGWELEAELPWLRHDGGELDKPIENWHDLWGLPDGNRDDAPRNLVNYSYLGAGAGFSMREEVQGWGDAQLALVRDIWRSDVAAISARAGVKFGSGDEDELLGSGSEDYYLSLNFSGRQKSDLPFLWHGQLGYLHAGDVEILGDIQEQDLWFASLGMEWAAWQQLHLKLQLDSHDAVADSNLDQLGEVAVQLTGGLSWLFAPGWEAEFSISEDISVDTAPDFVLQLGLRYRRSSP
jgi:hypothetical protein